jgi:hypothetical protein
MRTRFILSVLILFSALAVEPAFGWGYESSQDAPAPSGGTAPVSAEDREKAEAAKQEQARVDRALTSSGIAAEEITPDLRAAYAKIEKGEPLTAAEEAALGKVGKGPSDALLARTVAAAPEDKREALTRRFRAARDNGLERVKTKDEINALKDKTAQLDQRVKDAEARAQQQPQQQQQQQKQEEQQNEENRAVAATPQTPMTEEETDKGEKPKMEAAKVTEVKSSVDSGGAIAALLGAGRSSEGGDKEESAPSVTVAAAPVAAPASPKFESPIGAPNYLATVGGILDLKARGVSPGAPVFPNSVATKQNPAAMGGRTMLAPDRLLSSVGNSGQAMMAPGYAATSAVGSSRDARFISGVVAAGSGEGIRSYQDIYSSDVREAAASGSSAPKVVEQTVAPASGHKGAK